MLSLKKPSIGFIGLGFAAFLFRRYGCGGFLGGALVVQGQEAFEDLFAGVGADGVADTVVFGKGFDFIEAVVKGEWSWGGEW